MTRFWSPLVHQLVPYTPGEQLAGHDILKLNTNENPYGPSPLALDAIRAATNDGLRLYPDPTGSALRAAIADTHGLTPDHIFVGNGSDEVLAHAFNAFFVGKTSIRFADITYSFYRTYCGLYGVQHAEIPLDAQFRIAPAAYCGGNGGVLVANPNAPTGIALDLDQIEQIVRQNRDVVVLVDEAYVDFGADSAASLVQHYDNLIVTQTFSKSRSLAGLRVGFAIGQPHLIEGLRRVKDSFNSYPLDRLALAGAQAAWHDDAWFQTTRRKVMADRDRLSGALAPLGFQTLPSAANFIFTTHATLPAVRIAADLRAQGILVRHFAKDRIDNWLRISIGTSADSDRLLTALGQIVAAG